MSNFENFYRFLEIQPNLAAEIDKVLPKNDVPSNECYSLTVIAQRLQFQALRKFQKQYVTRILFNLHK